MAKLSITDAAQWTGTFLRREWRLVAPVAMAFMALPRLALQLLVPGAGTMSGAVAQVQPWMMWLLPVLMLYLIGALALSAMALVPRISVGEALTGAATRLWVVLVVGILVSIGLMLVLAALSFGGALAGASLASLTRLGVLLCLFCFFAAGARLLPVMALVAVERERPVAALRRALALTRGHGWRLFGTVMLLFAATAVIMLAVSQALGVTALLIGKAAGQEQPALAIAEICTALVSAGLAAAFYIFAAGIYRQLRG